MAGTSRATDAALAYLWEQGARAAALSGRPADTHHLGKLILQALRDEPEFVLQIDGSTDLEESSLSVLARSVRCARALQALGLVQGDVIVLLAPNHLDLAIPLYAALYLGVISAPVDRTLTVNELTGTFTTMKPKAVFCQSERAGDVQRALNAAELSAHLVAFDGGDYLCSFQQFLDEYGEDVPIDEFEAAEFDPAEAVAMLISTSGTTGLPKAASATHYNFVVTGPYWMARFSSFPTPTQLTMVCAPLQWLSTISHFLLAPLYRYPRLQTALQLDRDHAYQLINKYRPTFAIFSPTLMLLLLTADRAECDFTCFESILLGGSATPAELIHELKEVTPATDVCNIFGLSEATAPAFHPDSADPVSCGRRMGCLRYRLVDMDTHEDISQPLRRGELWLKGPGIFRGYYNNPEATAAAFADGRWFKTGDVFYRDEHWGYHFVERHKLLLKYMSHHVSPVEVEGVIRSLAGVLDVAVSGVVDAACGELPVACVVRAPPPAPHVSADDVRAIVAENLSDAKQLRGGVIFLEGLPMTASTKLHRRVLRDMVQTMGRE